MLNSWAPGFNRLLLRQQMFESPKANNDIWLSLVQKVIILKNVSILEFTMKPNEELEVQVFRLIWLV